MMAGSRFQPASKEPPAMARYLFFNRRRRMHLLAGSKADRQETRGKGERKKRKRRMRGRACDYLLGQERNHEPQRRKKEDSVIHAQGGAVGWMIRCPRTAMEVGMEGRTWRTIECDTKPTSVTVKANGSSYRLQSLPSQLPIPDGCCNVICTMPNKLGIS